MGIQINGQTDTITAIDGSITVGTDLTVPGVLTYEDVTNIDSVGVITARDGIHVTGGSVGIGTDNPDAPLTIRETGDVQIRLKNSSGITKAYLGTAGAFGTGSTDDLRIRSEGNILFGSAGTERLRITSSGALNVASPSSTVAAGLLNVPNGSRVTTSSGTYVTGNGGIVDMARYEMIDKCITSFPANNNKICAINGAPLVINDARDSWSFYSNLPNYLLGTLTHDCINNTSFSFTLACTMTVFLGRSSGWNAVDLSGWSLIESDTNINPFGSSTRLYVKTLAAGTHNLDNDSAMYFFSI